MTTVHLREIAHARAGDKGDTAILSVFPLDDDNYEWLVAHVRYEIKSICGLQFVCAHALAGGVTTSLALDSHGKSLSSRLLGLPVPDPRSA
jgi:hypothetical protein